MQKGNFMDKIRKRLGMKTQEEKVDDGLRALRDLFAKMEEHDVAMTVDDMMINGSMAGKCVMLAMLSQAASILKSLRSLDRIKRLMDEQKDD